MMHQGSRADAAALMQPLRRKEMELDRLPELEELVQRPDVDAPGHIRSRDPLAVGREGDEVDPILELPAARLAERLGQLAVIHLP